MKKSNLILISALVLLMASILIGAIVVKLKFIGPSLSGDGNRMQQERPLEYFNKIKVRDNFVVYFTQDSIQSILVSADANLIDNIKTRVVNNELIIESLRRVRSRDELRVDVSNPDLIRVEASRSAKFITQNQLRLLDLEIRGNAGSFMDIGGFFETLTTTQNAGARLVLRGSAQSINLEANAGGSVNAKELEAEKANVVANAGAQVEVNAKELSINANAGSTVRYVGTPVISSINLSAGANASSIN